MFLEPGITYELHTIYTDLQRRHTFPTLTQEAQAVADFRERFGPTALSGLSGEALLRRLHGRDEEEESLVAHLEKAGSDGVGSLQGGSAFRYDLFFSRKRERWILGTPTASRPVSVAEAIDRATAHRDELVTAAAVLDRFASGADEAAYHALQTALDGAAPTISDSAWVHKYLSSLAPEKLDSFHTPERQRHHLLRLLLRPPQSSQRTRYVTAGLFVGVARVIGDVPLSHLGALLTARHGRRPRGYWGVSVRPSTKSPAGNGGWEAMLRDGYAPLTGNAATQARPGDVVAAMDGGEVMGLGIIRPRDSGYRFVEDKVPVEWRSLELWALLWPEREKTVGGLARILGRRPENVLEIERHLLVDTAPFQPEPLTTRDRRRTAQPPRVAEERSEYAASESAVGVDSSRLPLPPLVGMTARIESVLARKGQVILHGPPGTGKTYGAETAARELAARSWFGVAASRLTPAQSAALTGESGEFGLDLPPAGAVRFCCFHPAYGYEDFLEGYRPVPAATDDRTALVGEALRFERRDGIFKQLCRDAAAHPRGNFYLIIDEINRGDTPRIFGELLSVLEPGKRGKHVLLPLSGESFAVPPNVFLIGTMNTTDRSIAVLDAALRRRFGFIDTPPDLTLLANACVQGLPLAPWLAALNRRLRERLGADGRHLQIGHAYFLRDDGSPLDDLRSLANVLRDDIVPLIEEHAYEDPGLLAALLGTDLLDEQGDIRSELFEPDHEDELRRALLGFTGIAELTEIADANA